MSENSKIEWTDHTFNPWWGCQKVSEGCKNCYAETLDNRYNHDNPHWGPGSDRKPMSENYWKQPIKWNAAAKKTCIQAKVFCASMADIFEDHPQVVEHRKRLFALIEATPYLIWQLLTKRPENILKFLPERWAADLPFSYMPENLWLGTSVENQKQADERIPQLLQVRNVTRFLSCEPLLGPVNLGLMGTTPQSWGYGYTGIYRLIDWVIVGGESGPKARPMHPDWARAIRDECETAVPFLFKQWGEWVPVDRPWEHRAPAELARNEEWLNIKGGSGFHGEAVWRMRKVGKHAAGRLLDSKEHNEFPHPQQIKL
jgi:protein gp37